MPDATSIADIAVELRRKLAEIEALNAANAENAATVGLDQQSVGRISRIDALQHQALAQETRRRRHSEVQRIHAALARLDSGDFGWCLKCGEHIGDRRLALDPTLALCISCAK